MLGAPHVCRKGTSAEPPQQSLRHHELRGAARYLRATPGAPGPPSASAAATPEAAQAAARAATAPEPGGDARTGSSASGSADTGTSGGTGNTSGTGSTGRDDRSRYDRSDRTKNDPFSRRRPPPIDEDFATINAKRGATFEEARQAYREAAQRAHPDRGGDVETMQRINIAWDRIKQSFGR